MCVTFGLSVNFEATYPPSYTVCHFWSPSVNFKATYTRFDLFLHKSLLQVMKITLLEPKDGKKG